MINRYIKVTALTQIIPQIGVAVCDVIALIAVGYSYQNYGPYSIWLVLLIFGVVSVFVASVCMQIVAHMLGDRFTSTENDG